MVYSERVKAQGISGPLKALHVLAIIYAFGGVSALVALLSKFVVTPLFEQLSHDRSAYARDAQDKLMDLNFKLARVVTCVPRTHTKKYVDGHTQTATFQRATVVAEEQQNWRQFSQIFQSPAETEAVDLERKIIKSLDRTERYARALSYGQIQRFGELDVAEAARPGGQPDTMAALKKEIRALKGAVLSI